MVRDWELLAVEALPAGSALGRLRDVMRNAEAAALDAERAAAEAARAYGEAQEWLAAARWGTVAPEEFSRKTAEAELLRRELPALNATVETRRGALAKRTEAFAAQYRNYERNLSLRAAAVRQGRVNEIRRYETAILAAVADG